jgi:biotin synthase
MNKPWTFYENLTKISLAGGELDNQTCLDILTDPTIDRLPLLQAAYDVRKTHWGNDVTIHIINNAQNGLCPEDCAYCVQAKTSKADIDAYPAKEEEEILSEAKSAYEAGAYRYCMVFSGRGPRPKRVEQLATIIRKIKQTYPIQVCLSAGLMDDESAKQLKEAGLDRMNHNLNTSEANYPNICTTHTFQDRKNTLMAAKKHNLEICSGMIVGLGETPVDVIEVAKTLREMKSKSIPINFFIPIEGTQLEPTNTLSPEYALRVISLFRFLNPDAEIRMAAGREIHLRSLQVLGLYPASSLFMDGYLNTKGTNTAQTLQMIKDAGFTIRANFELDEILKKANETATTDEAAADSIIRKQLADLRPAKSCLPS